jgi:hypothetical protein
VRRDLTAGKARNSKTEQQYMPMQVNRISRINATRSIPINMQMGMTERKSGTRNRIAVSIATRVNPHAIPYFT